MYAIIKTGGKQYKVAEGDALNIERIPGAQVGDKVELPVICTVDGDKVVAVAAEASAATVTAEIIEEFRGDKQLVFKFKKRKNYKKMRGHRQNLMRVRIESVGAKKAARKSTKKAAEPAVEAAPEAVEAE